MHCLSACLDCANALVNNGLWNESVLWAKVLIVLHQRSAPVLSVSLDGFLLAVCGR